MPSFFKRYLNTISPHDEKYLKRRLPEFFIKLTKSRNGNIYGDDLPIEDGEIIKTKQAEDILSTWKNANQIRDVCEKHQIDPFDVVASICYLQYPINKKTVDINILKLLKQTQISPKLAVMMITAILNQTKRLHEILASVPCLPSEMIVAIIVYWYYTEKHFDKDEEWMRMEFEDRRPDQFRRQMAENAKLFTQLDRSFKTHYELLSEEGARFNKFDMNIFAEKIKKMSIEERQEEISKCRLEFENLRKKVDEQCRNDRTFLTEFEEKFAFCVENKLSYNESIELLPLQEIPSYSERQQSFVKTDRVKPVAKGTPIIRITSTSQTPSSSRAGHEEIRKNATVPNSPKTRPYASKFSTPSAPETPKKRAPVKMYTKTRKSMVEPVSEPISDNNQPSTSQAVPESQEESSDQTFTFIDDLLADIPTSPIPNNQTQNNANLLPTRPIRTENRVDNEGFEYVDAFEISDIDNNENPIITSVGTSEISETDSNSNSQTNSSIFKLIKQEIVDTDISQPTTSKQKRKSRDKSSEVPKKSKRSNKPEVEFPSLDLNETFGKLKFGDAVYFRPSNKPNEYILGVFTKFENQVDDEYCLEISYNRKTESVLAKNVAFKQPIQPNNEFILVSGARVVVVVQKRNRDDPLSATPAYYSGTIGNDKNDSSSEFLVFLDVGIPYYVDFSKIHIIVQQPVDSDKKFSLEKAANAYPETNNQYHTFVRPFLTRRSLSHNWPKLALESYVVDSKKAYEIQIKESILNDLVLTAILLREDRDLVLLRTARIDKRLKNVTQKKRIEQCRIINCENVKCKHKDEWIHRADITRIPHIMAVFNSYRTSE